MICHDPDLFRFVLQELGNAPAPPLQPIEGEEERRRERRIARTQATKTADAIEAHLRVVQPDTAEIAWLKVATKGVNPPKKKQKTRNMFFGGATAKKSFFHYVFFVFSGGSTRKTGMKIQKNKNQNSLFFVSGRGEWAVPTCHHLALCLRGFRFFPVLLLQNAIKLVLAVKI